jgi:hypothetical protein
MKYFITKYGPSVFGGLSLNITEGAQFLRTPIIPAIIERIIDDHSANSNLVTSILISEVAEGLLQQRKSDCSEVLGFDRHEHIAARVICRRS